MVLYHGSNDVIPHPRVDAGRPGLDFGAGLYDYVEGGVANDRVIDTVEGYINGTVDAEHALVELSKHQPNHQICFLSQKMVQECLTFKEALYIDVK